MNYLILNGVKSTEITGLLIQSLPSISKPLMRTQVEEIDGRDGDIVTKLGYSAYDKKVSIGLHGDYNVDDVIAYFDSEGEVTFSNEIDKYYNYQIIQQIDFERLIRFKTAEVNFHVQPFKYSTVDRIFSLYNSLTIPDYSATKNGITVTVSNGNVSVSGTGSAATEFYIPISPKTFQAGNYTLMATADGSGQSACSIRLVKDAPSNSFGGKYATLSSDPVTIDAELTQAATYNYLYMFIANGKAMSFTFNVAIASSQESLVVTNQGNTAAKPIVTITGSGTINLSLNGEQIFVINLSGLQTITIDAAQMNAYQGDILMNRYVLGDYDNMVLGLGRNTFTWTGDLRNITVENFSRWI